MRHKYALAGVFVATLLFTGSAQAASKYADLRVVTSDGTTLAEHRQYTDDVKFKASEDALCFGPYSESSNMTYELDKPTALGVLVDASKNDSDLKPLSITDAFLDDFGSYGICGMGEAVAGDAFGEPYWYSAFNGEGAFAGPNQVPVKDGDDHLWYLATGSETAISELQVKAPYKVKAGQSFTAKVKRLLPDGTTEPAEGVQVTGAANPTDAAGETEVSVDAGRTSLVATGGDDDVPSAAREVCAKSSNKKCPAAQGIVIAGSPGDDKIESGKGKDTIKCGKGKDTVVRSKKDRGDDIAKDCEKVVRK